jgi:SPP1 family phage portal protein
MDGYTEYQWDKNHAEGMVRQEKRGYIAVYESSEAFGDEIYEYRNYPTFPVVPCWANERRQSELLPLKATIDAFDLINAGYCNQVDDASLVYWTITNAGGMDDADLVQFLDKMRKLHAAQTDGDQTVTPTTVDVPYASREAILERLEKQLYRDAMALNTYDIANGAVTATQIEAAYEPLNEKLDAFEAEITDFIMRLLAVAGVEDEPMYTRSIIVNKAEEITSIVNSALYLDDQYVTEKIMTIMGDKDKVEDALDSQARIDVQRMTGGTAINNGEEA